MNGPISNLGDKSSEPLGDKNALLPLVYHDIYSVPLPASHPFPMPKFVALRKWLGEAGVLDESQLHQPHAASSKVLDRAHDRAYWRGFLDNELSEKALKRIGFPWSTELAKRSRIAVGGTVLTCELALREGMAAHLAGGTHHAHRDFGSGYCIFNDLAAAALAMLASKAAERVMIVDLDVHQGDGSATILADEPRAFTFSMHAARNFPARKQQSDLDVPLPEGLGDAGYMALLKEHLPKVVERFKPELVIYDAGVDVHESDRLGQLKITDDGLWQRERYVINYLRDRNIAVAGVIGGGYDRDVEKLVARHAVLHQVMLERWQQEKAASRDKP